MLRFAFARRLLARRSAPLMLCAGLGLAGCSAFPSHRGDVVYVDTTSRSLLAREENAKGVHFLGSGDVGLAKHSFEKAIGHDPYFVSPHNNLGHMAYTRGDMASAAAAFDAAMQIDPNNPVPHNNLGLALEHGGRPEDAVVEYQVAHQLDPKNPQYLGNLVRARLTLSPYDESILPDLRRLRFLETRPDWKDWIDEQLAIRFNPYLDRGPENPDLSELDDVLADGSESQPDLSEFIIEEVPPLAPTGSAAGTDVDSGLIPTLPVPSPLSAPTPLPAPRVEDDGLSPSSRGPASPVPTPAADSPLLIMPPAPVDGLPGSPQPIPLPPGGVPLDGSTVIIPDLSVPPELLPPWSLPPLAPPIDWFAPAGQSAADRDAE